MAKMKRQLAAIMAFIMVFTTCSLFAQVQVFAEEFTSGEYVEEYLDYELPDVDTIDGDGIATDGYVNSVDGNQNSGNNENETPYANDVFSDNSYPISDYQGRKNGLIVTFKQEESVFSVKSLIFDHIISATNNSISDAEPEINDIVVEMPYSNRIAFVSVNEDEDIDQLLTGMLSDPSVEAVQRDYELESQNSSIVTGSEEEGTEGDNNISNPIFSLSLEQWALKNYGQTVNGRTGVAGIDINLPLFTDEDDPMDSVIVAVIDTGVDVENPSLLGKMASGWDFVNNDDIVFDEGDTYHGTQVSAIIAANGEGMSGAADNVLIMPLKFIQDGYGYTSDALSAISFAIANGVKIINCSWGSAIYNPVLEDIIEENSDILFVCAAGNNGDSTPIYPAAYGLPNIISVAAIGNTGQIAASSNYGSDVDIAAPGEDIYTVSDSGEFTFVTGTSMSAGYVSAAAALYLGRNSDVAPEQIKDAMIEAATKDQQFNGLVTAEGYLNTSALMGIEEPEPGVNDSDIYGFGELPPEVSELLASDQFYSSLTLEKKELLTQFAYLREDTMEACANAGYSIKDSVVKALIMQMLNIGISDAISMIESRSNEADALRDARQFSKWQYKYAWLTGDFSGELIQLMIQGYSAKDVVYSAIAAQALEVDYEEIIIKDSSALMNSDLSGFSDIDAVIIRQTVCEYSLDVDALLNYMTENDVPAPELRDAITEYRISIGMLPETAFQTLGVGNDSDTGKYSDSPFYFAKGSTEGINYNTGALAYEDEIAVIPGRGGLNLELVAQYSSDRAYAQAPVLRTGYQEKALYWYVGVYTVFAGRRCPATAERKCPISAEIDVHIQ